MWRLHRTVFRSAWRVTGAVLLVVATASCGDGPDRPATTASPSPSSSADPGTSVVTVTGPGVGAVGVVFTRDGHILTANPAGAAVRTTVTVGFGDGRSGQATVVGSDARTNLAIVRTDTTSGLVPATFGDSDTTRWALRHERHGARRHPHGRRDEHDRDRHRR